MRHALTLLHLLGTPVTPTSGKPRVHIRQHEVLKQESWVLACRAQGGLSRDSSHTGSGGPSCHPHVPVTWATRRWFSLSQVSLIAAFRSKRRANCSSFSCRMSSLLRASSRRYSASSRLSQACVRGSRRRLRAQERHLGVGEGFHLFQLSLWEFRHPSKVWGSWWGG